jgi:hypothetical protein
VVYRVVTEPGRQVGLILVGLNLLLRFDAATAPLYTVLARWPLPDARADRATRGAGQVYPSGPDRGEAALLKRLEPVDFAYVRCPTHLPMEPERVPPCVGSGRVRSSG